MSGPQVIEGFHGVPYDRPHQRTREVIEICRRVWQRDPLEYQGACYTLPLPPEQGTGQGKPLKMNVHPLRSQIPIYLASLGPKNVELTAEMAEGWLPIYFIPEHASTIWGPALKRGLAKRAPDLPPLEIVAGGPVAIGDGLEDLRNTMRPRMALYIGGMGRGRRTSTTTWSAATATRPRPPRSRTCTWPARSARPKRWCRPRCSKRSR